MTEDADNAWVETDLDRATVDEEIDLAVSWARSQLSEDTKRDIARCNSDLYFGPLYFDVDGEECSCFDEGAKQFDFRGALARIGEWADAIEDIQIKVAFNTVTEESHYERLDGSARRIIEEILGKELAKLL